MRTQNLKATFKAAARVMGLLLFGAVASFAQQQVGLTAGSSNAILPDGSTVPMWGYMCGTAVAGSTATCAPLNPTAAALGNWSPVVITVPTGATGGLQINLTNNLPVAPGATSGVPTSLFILGQVGGGLGNSATKVPSPAHDSQIVTWSTVGTSTAFTPPPQPDRVQSFATEVATGTTANLVWATLQPGTYLIESGTHPSIQGAMGLYGILVVTTAPTSSTTAGVSTESVAGTAYPANAATGTAAISYDAEVPMLFSEIDPIQNRAVSTAVNTSGFSENAMYEQSFTAAGAGPVSQVNVSNGGSGYSSAPNVTITGGGGSGAIATATINGSGQVVSITLGNPGVGYLYNPTVTIGGGGGTGAEAVAVVAGTVVATNTMGHCQGAAACYPPAVNYTPLYYMINGAAFNKTSPSLSLFSTTPNIAVPATAPGNILVRMVNAGLRMHVPSIVSSLTTNSATSTSVPGFSLIAEDGSVLPGNHRVQTDVFMAAGKVFDVMINVPAACTPVAPATTCTNPAIPVFDRELSLSANAISRDSGMLAYINVNNASTLPVAAVAAVARADNYPSLIAGQTFTVADVSKGVIANDTNVFGVHLLTPPANGTVTLNANGTFTYVPTGAATADTFTYCANGTVTGTTCSSGITATVTLGAATLESASGISAYGRSYAANVATYLTIKSPGVLSTTNDTSGNPADKDAQGYPLKVSVSTIGSISAGLTVVADAEGGFTATSTGAGTYTFAYQAQNSQGVLSAPATVSVTFPTPSNLAVTVLDGYDKKTLISDYRWIIEEDRTFYIDPTKTTNNGGTTGATVVPVLGVNFHSDYMPMIAQGCTGTLSCEGGQTMFDAGTPCTSPGVPAGCSATAGQHIPAVCDVGDGVCRPDPTGNGFAHVLPSSVHLDPTKRYYISVLPGDAAGPFASSYSGAPGGTNNGCATTPATTTPGTSQSCGHGMGGTALNYGQLAVTVLTQPAPYPTGKYSVLVFEDDFPLNGEQDTGGGTGILTTVNEPGLGGFQIHLWDAMAKFGDFTGQMTYDMFNQPLTNSLAGQIDPTTGLDACPMSAVAESSRTGMIPDPNHPGQMIPDPTQTGKTGMVVTCPLYESDGKTPSPLVGQAVIDNLMPGQWAGIATPGADRIARGEEWLQTNTLDGQKGHDIFTRIGEPAYFQEYGPAGYHNAIGFANPAIINARHLGVCQGTDPNFPATSPIACNNIVKGKVTGERLSKPPDERLYSSSTHDTFYWTQCYVSFGDPDGEDFAFTKCAADGTFTLTGLPDGDWRITVFDQWNDLLVDGLSTPVRLGSATNAGCPGSGSSSTTCDVGDIATVQWQTNLYTKTFIDDAKAGVSPGPNTPGIPFANVAVRLRDGQLYNLIVTDFTGTANFNETFPLFNWYTVETDVTRYKNTGTHVVYDVGGPADGSPSCGQAGYPPCGSSVIGKYLANTDELVSVPTNLRVPGAVYCAAADCTGKSIQNGPASSDPPSVCTTTTTGSGSSVQPGGATTCSTQLSSGRIDPPWNGVEGWQGFPGQNNFLEFGKEPYVAGENGGIKGHVIYASTRPFDDPQQLVQTQWEPLLPHITINLYQEGFAGDGVTPTLKLVDTTQTSSWDDYAQGFHTDATGNVIPNMSCPGQGSATGAIPDLFFFSLANQPDYIDLYSSIHNGTPLHTLPFSSQFKCYDGMHNWNQLQPAPYDGMYQFPSVTSSDPTTGKPLTTNCTICSPNTVVPTSDLYYGLPMLPTGKYVVEVVMPPGYELVKEEDKNILIGDNFVAPVTQEFGGLGNIFIIPDQASVASSQQYPGPGYNANNAQNPTQSIGTSEQNGIVPGFIPEPIWPCVGEARVVPDYISLYPQTHQVAPFAGATRNLCDRKEVTLADQAGAIAKFFIYTSIHTAAKFTGVITDDYTSEFDPFSPQFGEKFSPPNMPISIRDWYGNETNRVYSDQWGVYDGMTYSSWEVNPPNPTGYSPTMMVVCMNDPGPIPGPNGTVIADPLFDPEYSQFCYELAFMPGTTAYEDTPVVPTSAFAGAGYNNVDCWYPDLTPAIAEVDSDAGVGPWIPNDGHSHTLTIRALGDQMVPNYAYAGPSATTAPYNAKTIKRHYGFGTQCSTGRGGRLPSGCTAASSVTIGGRPLGNVHWTDAQITGTVPSGVPLCTVQQQGQYYNPQILPPATVPTARCGELMITAGNGRQSIDAVTVTVGGKAPTHVSASATIQSAIDAAAPGDLIIVDPTCTTTATGATLTSCPAPGTAGVTFTTAAHNEMIIMWKPVRLQGVGAATSVINANTQPAGKMDVWREYVNCLFGLSLSGTPLSSKPIGTDPNPNVYDPAGQVSCPGNGWRYFNNYDESATTSTLSNNPAVAGEVAYNAQVDRLPLEAVVGWNAELNGNLAELLQEPSLMGALEGAAVTVLSKGANFPSDQYDPTLLMGFPTGTTLLQGPTAECTTTTIVGRRQTVQELVPNPFPSNYDCNPSSIDGLGMIDSSQGGGAIFVHGWGSNLQIANNRIYNNAGTLSGGINIGQGEYPPAYIQGSTTNAAPGSCLNDPTLPVGTTLPYCQNVNVNVHNNFIALNSSTGDELFSATPAGAGAVSFCTGSDYYQFNYNWVCGNLSSGDGGGVGHLGFSYNGDIEHNTIIFNQSLNPTIPANGGGIIVMGTPDADLVCNGNANIDADCAPFGAPGGSPGNSPVGSIGPSDGAGPNLLINANLIMGNGAEAGTGGGIAFNAVNGADVVAFPNSPENWNGVTVTNNIIADNVAGWDGAGISLSDSLNVDIINNTIASNSTTASAGILFNTIGAPLASQGGTNCNTTSVTSCPQVGGLVAIQNGAVLSANIHSLNIVCPPGHFQPGTPAANGTCTSLSYPKLENDIFWQNSTYYIGVGAQSAQYQQNIVSLYNAFGNTLAPNQPQTDAVTAHGSGVTITGGTGACVTASYWDIGIRGDTTPTTFGTSIGGNPVTLNPTYSILTAGYTGAGTHNANANPNFISQYCDGSRQPPESGASGYSVPPGISDASVPNPIFNLTPTATVDEGNNWVNLRWGPLSLTNPTILGTDGNYGGGANMGNYGLAGGTGNPLNSMIPCSNFSNYNDAPAFDFYGTPRKAGCHGVEPGAVEDTVSAATGPEIISLDPNTAPIGSTDITVNLSGTGFTGVTNVTFAGGIHVNSFVVVNDSSINANITIPRTVAAGTYNVTVNGLANGEAAQFTVTIAEVSFTNPFTLASFPAPTTPVTAVMTVTNTGNGTSFPGPFILTAPPAAVKNGPTNRANPGVFSVTGGTCAVGLVVEVGSSCTINVTYTQNGSIGVEVGHITLTGEGFFTGGGGGGAEGTVSSGTFNAN